VARSRHRGGPRLAFPFLADGPLQEQERYNQIADEAQAYYAALAGELIPGQEDAASEMPEPVLWLTRVERYGLPCAGGFLDQPYHFMQDVEWARRGRAQFQAIQAVNEAARRQSAPTE